MKRFLMISLTVVLGAVAGTVNADTKLKEPWVDSDYVANNDAFKSLLVIGVPDHPENRRSLEDSLVAALEKSGVKATASLDIMAADTEVNRDSVVAALQGMDVDAVFLTSLFRVDDVEFVEGGDPGTMRTDRDFAIQLWENYEGTRDQVLNAPRKEKHRLVLENELYDMKSESLVWTVQSYSMNPKSADDVIKKLSKLVTERLRKDLLI